MNKQKGSTMHFSRMTISVFALVCGVLGAAVAAQAATIIVTSDSGGLGGPDCTLRDAMTAANTDTATGGCPAGNGGDVIELPVGATITLTVVDNDSGEGGGANGLPLVTSVVTINGNGTTVQRDADSTLNFRIFRVGEGGDLTLNDLTVSNGHSSVPGGGISNGGTLGLTNCTVSDNAAIGHGGIANGGTMTLTDSTVSGNTAGQFGHGGISNGGTMTLIDCTVSRNTGPGGAGIKNWGTGTMTLTDSTVSGNTAIVVGESGNDGSGIINEGTMTLTNSTVSGNTATAEVHGGGIWNSGTMTLRHSIVANSTGGSDCENDGGTVIDDGFNIVEDGTCITAETSMMGDPMLGPLQDNGGPTETHALLAGSPAIDEIPSENCEVDSDQRGVPRPQGDGCDIGSYELKSFCLADFDGDGVVDASDLAVLLGAWGPCADCGACPADFDGDCIVNAADLALLLGAWGACF